MATAKKPTPQKSTNPTTAAKPTGKPAGLRFGLNAAMADVPVPALHRGYVHEATERIDQAARLLGQTRHYYRQDDPLVEQLLEALLRLDVALAVLDGWLERHPARG